MDIVSFNSEEVLSATTREEIESSLAAVNEQHAYHWKKIKQLSDICKKLEEKRSDIDKKTLFPTDDDITPEKVLSLKWEEVSGDLYKMISEWFVGFEYVSHGGYYPMTGQVSIHAMMYKDKPVEPQIEEIMQFVPYIKEFETDEDGVITPLDIFESTLSEHGSYIIHIRKGERVNQKPVALTMMRYHTFSVIKEFDDLESCLRYVHQHHPYDRDEGEDEED